MILEDDEQDGASFGSSHSRGHEMRRMLFVSGRILELLFIKVEVEFRDTEKVVLRTSHSLGALLIGRFSLGLSLLGNADCFLFFPMKSSIRN